jgi:hypothetical protein
MTTPENIIQAEIYKWFNNNYCLKIHDPQCVIFSVPNGSNRNIKEAMMLQATGLVPGVSDMIVVMPKRILFVEVKNEVGVQSDKQKVFEVKVKKLGFEYHVVRNLKEFKELL